MPFALLFFGLVVIVAAYRNKHTLLFQQFRNDFTGEGNFFYWIGAILIIGLIGYYGPLERASRLFLALIIIAIVLSQEGLFAKMKEAIDSGTAPANETATPQGETSQTPTVDSRGNDTSNWPTIGGIKINPDLFKGSNLDPSTWFK